MDNQFSLQRLEQIAQVACFSIEYQKKQQAENYFLELAKNLSLPLLQQILVSGSDTLIFVSIEYANKLIEEYSLQFLKDIFNTVESQVSSWYIPEAHYFRRIKNAIVNGNFQLIEDRQITKYVLNSISLFLSNSMKRFFLQDTFQKRAQIVNWIGVKQNQRYKLWLYTIFIENISQIDTSMGFIKFRTLSYNFQQQVIPIISKCIIPFLYNVEDIMKVNELSSLQQHLNVDETINQFKQQKIFQNLNEFKFAQLVFELLHCLVFYNFHLTYTEYEQQSTFDNCLICFPQEFTTKVVTEEFIKSMGYVIERLIDLMPQSSFLKTTLECMQKIFLTKLSYVDELKKQNFIKQCTVTLTNILKKKNLNQFILTKIMVCNNKFLNNVEISYLKQKVQLKQSFHQWLLAITETCHMVLENIDLAQQFNFNLEESLVIECLDLYQKIVAHMCSISYYAFEESTYASLEQRQFIEKNVQDFTQILIKKLLLDQSKPLIEGSTAEIFKSNILEIKTFCGCFFQPFKQLASLNYDFLFRQVYNNMSFALDSNTVFVKFNLFMLLSEIVDRNFLERNIVMVKVNDEEQFTVSKCVNKALKFLEIYLKNKPEVIINEQIVLMDISILIFLDKILSEFLGFFENHESSIEIKHKIFLNVLQIQNKGAFLAQASQEFVLFCVQSVLSYLLIYNKNQESNHINDFIFETINRILMKFKWGIKRQVFKNSQIYMKLSHFFNQVEKETNIKSIEMIGLSLNLSVFNQFQRLKWRKKLLKVIALLYFDDVIDDFKLNLENLFSSLKNQHILTILLDLEGIGQAIDTTSIYKCFLEMIEKYFNVERLTNQLVKLACTFNGYDSVTKKFPKVKIIKEIIRMHKAILSNKGQRISSPKNMQSVYLIIKDLMGYWIDFLKMSENQEWVSIIREVLNLFIELIKCDKINFYLIQRICLGEYVEFFDLMLTKMFGLSENIQQNPKLYEAYLNILLNLARELLEVIFFPSGKIKTNELNEKNRNISQTFFRLVLIVFKRVPVFLEEIKIGSLKNESYLQKSLQILKYTLTFIDFKRRQHINYRQEMIFINYIIDSMKPLIFQYSKQIFDYLTADKHFSVHRRILILIMYQSTIIYPDLMETLIGGMNLPNYLFVEVKQCLDCIKRQQQQLFIDRFKTWLRMLHMTEDEVKKNKEDHRDFYGFMGIL